ncbi:MAG: hypothetical protein QOJ20_5827 [Mycobacterium sp.]|nr:hypothetical protein [Mycobacterium sp.]
MWRPVLYRSAANNAYSGRCVCLGCDMLRCWGIPLWAPRHREATDVKARCVRSVRRVGTTPATELGSRTIRTVCKGQTKGLHPERLPHQGLYGFDRNGATAPTTWSQRSSEAVTAGSSIRSSTQAKWPVARSADVMPLLRLPHHPGPWSFGRNHAHAAPSALDVRRSVGLPSSPAIG